MVPQLNVDHENFDSRGRYVDDTDPVTKVTILPRGRALGYTMVLPVNDKYSVTRNELLDQLTYAMGGRVAEEIIFHDPSALPPPVSPLPLSFCFRSCR